MVGIGRKLVPTFRLQPKHDLNATCEVCIRTWPPSSESNMDGTGLTRQMHLHGQNKSTSLGVLVLRYATNACIWISSSDADNRNDRMIPAFSLHFYDLGLIIFASLKLQTSRKTRGFPGHLQ